MYRRENMEKNSFLYGEKEKQKENECMDKKVYMKRERKLF